VRYGGCPSVSEISRFGRVNRSLTVAALLPAPALLQARMFASCYGAATVAGSRKLPRTDSGCKSRVESASRR
jgi:hypothetical protein